MKQICKDWKIYVAALCALTLAQSIWLTSWFMLKHPTKKICKQPKQATLHIFIHGTFGSSLGLLSFFPVIHDSFKGSHYVKTARLMRKDPFFYKDQPMLERGMQLIKPSYELLEETTNRKIAYPLIKGYADINDFIKNESATNNNIDTFYTFGWSGLLSRQRRRQEALRLYNALQEETVALQKKGFRTKIIISAHSHGGNIALNLAGINRARKLLALDLKLDKSIHNELEQMCSFLSTCTTKQYQSQKGQKAFDYLPENSPIYIHRLYLLGTPIQPETDHYATDTNTFKRIYNFYSENDPIQKMDWVSTSRYYSDQRFNRISASSPAIIQVKVTYDRVQEEKPPSLLQRLIPSIGDPANRFDPDHRDFWFINYEKDLTNKSFLYPLPLFIFSPLLHTLIKKQPVNDLTINISRMHNNLRFATLTHDDETYLHSEIIPLSFVQKIQKLLLAWQPSNNCKKQEFDIITKHVKKASS